MKRSRELGILFDLGGTLCPPIDFESHLLGSDECLNWPELSDLLIQELAASLKKNIKENYKNNPLIQLNYFEVWYESLRSLGLRDDDDSVEFIAHHLTKSAVINAGIYPHTMSLLKWLKTIGVPLVLVSNITGPPSAFHQGLSHLGISPFFEGFVWSQELSLRKPSPEMFVSALEILNLNPGRVLMVGDSETADIDGGRRLAMDTLRVYPPGAGHSATNASFKCDYKDMIKAVARWVNEKSLF